MLACAEIVAAPHAQHVTPIFPPEGSKEFQLAKPQTFPSPEGIERSPAPLQNRVEAPKPWRLLATQVKCLV